MLRRPLVPPSHPEWPQKGNVSFCLQELKKVTLKVAHELVEKHYVNWGTSKTEHVVNTYSRENRKWTSHFEETAASNNSMLAAQVVKSPSAMWETWVLSLFGDDPLWRERLPTPVSWPEESHGLYSPQGRKESDTTEQLSLSFNFRIFKHVAKKRTSKFSYTTMSGEIKYTGDIS